MTSTKTISQNATVEAVDNSPNESIASPDSGHSEQSEHSGVVSSSHQPKAVGDRKRKREAKINDVLEIDPSLPEPLSKKAQRKSKKSKTHAAPSKTSGSNVELKAPSPEAEEQPKAKAEKPSDDGIWIGNLPWTATKASLQAFLATNAGIAEDKITRIHMPPPDKAPPPKQFAKPQNKGFAYVNFTGPAEVEAAIAISETLMDGRRVLIKNAKSFEGRPQQPKDADGKGTTATSHPKHPPSRRVFVGNLAFDVTKEDLIEHFVPCGEIEDIHMATFEDTGKCKGYAWVTFDYVEAAESAVRGWIQLGSKAKEQDESGSDAEGTLKEDGPGKSAAGPKKKKWFVNRLKGRTLRCEFGEDPAVRYKRRFGKGSADAEPEGGSVQRRKAKTGKFSQGRNARPSGEYRGKPANGLNGRKFDARTVKPGAAHATAQRATAAIVKATGTKTTFD